MSTFGMKLRLDWGRGTLESLVDALESYDFAVLVLTADDLIVSRGVEQNSARDNVLIELGLFIGKLGRQRTFLLVPKESNVKIPSDLAGITFATFSMPERPEKTVGCGWSGVHRNSERDQGTKGD